MGGLSKVTSTIGANGSINCRVRSRIDMTSSGGSTHP